MVGVKTRLKPPRNVSSCLIQAARCAMAAVPLFPSWDLFARLPGRCFLAAALSDRRGVNSAEYAILAVGIIIVVGAAVLTLSDPTTGAFAVMGNAILSTQVSLAGTR